MWQPLLAAGVQVLVQVLALALAQVWGCVASRCTEPLQVQAQALARVASAAAALAALLLLLLLELTLQQLGMRLQCPCARLVTGQLCAAAMAMEALLLACQRWSRAPPAGPACLHPPDLLRASAPPGCSLPLPLRLPPCHGACHPRARPLETWLGLASCHGRCVRRASSRCSTTAGRTRWSCR